MEVEVSVLLEQYSVSVLSASLFPYNVRASAATSG